MWRVEDMWRDRTPDTFRNSSASAHALSAIAGCAHEARYTAAGMSVLGGGGRLADRKRPEHRDSLTEDDTARAAVPKRVTGIAGLAEGDIREAVSDLETHSASCWHGSHKAALRAKKEFAQRMAVMPRGIRR